MNQQKYSFDPADLKNLYNYTCQDRFVRTASHSMEGLKKANFSLNLHPV